ncbi:MAG TPA: hypothetical protein VGQ12_01075 [Candidatus Angelobacter sp.]|jgi:hypothetical protein|nr:hypothetical protein [Candidatus Angelobacter sp.]
MNDLKKMGQARMRSEILFEKCLNQAGLRQWEYEPTIRGKAKKPDYRVTVQGDQIFFEVKEFETQTPVDGAGGAYDPYAGIRAKIGKLKEKFREYKGRSCCGVLYSEYHPEIDLESPEIVMGAMLGDLTIHIPMDRNTGFQAGEIKAGFGQRGRMINYGNMTPQNTTISALVALDFLPLGQRRFEIATAEEEKMVGKEISEDGFFAWIEEHKNRGNDLEEKILRTVVFDNPYASNPLRRDILTGPFDERYGLHEGYIQRVFVGERLSAIQLEEEKYGLNLGPFAKTLAKGFK